MMHPSVLRPRKSYREQFLLRCSMEQKQSTSNTKFSKRMVHPSALEVLSDKATVVQANKTKQEPTTQTTPFAKPQVTRNDNKDKIDPLKDLEDYENQIGEARKTKNVHQMKTDGATCDQTNKQILAFNHTKKISSASSFKQMITEYANTLDLTKSERQLLGFSETVHGSADPTVCPPLNLTNSELQFIGFTKTKHGGSTGPTVFSTAGNDGDAHDGRDQQTFFSKKDSVNQSADLSLLAKTEAQKDYNDNMNWDWESDHDHGIVSSAGGCGKNGTTTGVNVRKNPRQRKHGNSESVHPHSLEFFTIEIINLINKICEDGHVDNVRSCFKCQHKESFKSFTLCHLNELYGIMENKHLSFPQRAGAVTELLEMWIYQLSEQIIGLADIYNDTVQSCDKVKEVLLQSRNAMRSLQKECAHAKALEYEVSLRDKKINTMKCEYEELEETLQETQADVQSLTELVIRLRDKGIWDINGLPMGDATFKKIFNDDYCLHGAKVLGPKEFSAEKREWRNEVDQLKSERDTLRAIVASKNKEIHRLKSIDFSINTLKNNFSL